MTDIHNRQNTQSAQRNAQSAQDAQDSPEISDKRDQPPTGSGGPGRGASSSSETSDTPQTGDSVLYEVEGAVATITLNEPKTLNASSVKLRAGLEAAIDAADKDPAVLVVVLIGAGRSFSAGANLTESFTANHATIYDHILKDHKTLIDKISNSDNTYIAAIHGAAAGVMTAYALTCDLVVMGESGYLYCPFFAISLVPDGGATSFLLDRFGYHRAFEMIATGKRMGAKACLEAGVANKVVPDDEMRESAQAFAAEIAQNAAPLTLKYGKRLLRLAETASRQDITIQESAFQHICSQSTDFTEGVAAFLTKRKPQFTGK